MTLQIVHQKQRRKLTEEDVAKIIERDIQELLCPLFRNGYCTAYREENYNRCFNPRAWESCPFFTANWEGI